MHAAAAVVVVDDDPIPKIDPSAHFSSCRHDVEEENPLLGHFWRGRDAYTRERKRRFFSVPAPLVASMLQS